jgi:hypothetical protein
MDAFKYNNPTEGVGSTIVNNSATTDYIVDFVPGTDYFLLSKATFVVNANSTGTALDATDLVTGINNETAISHFIFDATSHTLYYDSDANGPGVAVVIANLINVSSITAADIHLF